MNPILRLEGVAKSFGPTLVLHGLELEVMPGEFLTLLGPSGCGKTTTLRIIAGLEAPTSGRVFLDGRDVTDLPPEKRDVNTVFQNYALFPHMNVAQNIAYGLKLKGVARAERERRVEDALRLVRLEGYGKRAPTQLSGGQRQRVAIARSLVLGPKVLLLDEPLGALDLQLRTRMQGELKQLQRESGVTFIYITHDQEEALNMSTRVAVMDEGRIEQIGTPEEVYERPASLFVAGFVGQSNLLHGVLEASGDGLALRVENALLPVAADGRFRAGDPAVLCLRPQRVRYAAEPPAGPCMEGTLRSKEYSGGMQHTRIELAGGPTLKAVSQTDAMDGLPVGSRRGVHWDARRAPLVGEARGWTAASGIAASPACSRCRCACGAGRSCSWRCCTSSG